MPTIMIDTAADGTTRVAPCPPDEQALAQAQTFPSTEEAMAALPDMLAGDMAAQPSPADAEASAMQGGFADATGMPNR